MTSGSIVFSAALVLVGWIILRGINPVTAAMEVIILSLYRATAITAALAKTSDIAYLRLRWEYRTAVNEIAAQRTAMLKAEEQRLAGMSPQPYSVMFRRVSTCEMSDDLSPASGARHGA